MKKYKKIENYKSAIIDDIMNEQDDLEFMKTRNKMLLAANIEDYMLHLKWNKSQLASRTNRNPSEISKWFSGTHNFTIETLTEIAFTFGIELNQLFIKINNKPKVVKYKEIVKQGVSPISITTPIGFSRKGSDFYKSKNDKSQIATLTVNEE